jgi:putative CocE/NonD family hydrolase
MRIKRGLKITLLTLLLLGTGVYLLRAPLITLALDSATAPFIGPHPPFTHSAQPVQTATVPMRDGTQLHTRLYLPEGPGPWPALLVRDPYQFARFLTCHYYVRYGFACVHQDVRGQGDSQGEWYPIKHESSDGEDTLAWLIAQPWQDGNIALVGGSYLGLVQWAVADRLPPQVKTMVPTTSHGDFYRMVYHGGHFAQAIAGLWSAEIFYPLQDKEDAGKQWLDTVAFARPAAGVDPTLFKGAWRAYADYLAHPDLTDAYWQQPFYQQLRNAYKTVSVPVLWIARWHDFFLEGTLQQFVALPTQRDSVLLIQPGEHAGKTNQLPYEHKDFQEFEVTLAWLDHYLRGTPLPARLQHRVIYFENGADRWRSADSWPPPTQTTVWHFANLPAAAQCGGQLLPGDLLPEEQAEPPGEPARFTYDPDNPVPTRGGSFLLNPNIAPVAVAEQGDEACQRPDVLSFVSPPFAQGLHIAGAIRVDLALSSNAPDTAFTVKISEVFADGRILNIRDDITSLSAYLGRDSSYQPGREVSIGFDLAPIDWTVAAGSKLRVDISSSNAPAFPAHSNRTGLWSEIAQADKAQQTLRSGALALPLVRR